MEAPFTFYQSYPINVLTKHLIRPEALPAVGQGMERQFDLTGASATSSRMCEWLPLCHHQAPEKLYKPLENGAIYHTTTNQILIRHEAEEAEESAAPFYIGCDAIPIAVSSSLVRTRQESEGQATTAYSGSLYLGQICSFLPTLEIALIRSIQNEFCFSEISHVRKWANCSVQFDVFQSLYPLIVSHTPEAESRLRLQKAVCTLDATDVQRCCLRIHAPLRDGKSQGRKRPSFYVLFFKQLDKWKSCTENLDERFPIHGTDFINSNEAPKSEAEKSSGRTFHDEDRDYYLLAVVPIYDNRPYHDLPAIFCSMADRIVITAARVGTVTMFQVLTVKFESLQPLSLPRWNKRYDRILSNVKLQPAASQLPTSDCTATISPDKSQSLTIKPHTAVLKKILDFLTRVDQDPLRAALLLPQLSYYPRERVNKRGTGKCWLVYKHDKVASLEMPPSRKAAVGKAAVGKAAVGKAAVGKEAAGTGTEAGKAKKGAKKPKPDKLVTKVGNTTIRVQNWEPLTFGVGPISPKEFPVEATATSDYITIYLPNTQAIPVSGPCLSVVEIE